MVTAAIPATPRTPHQEPDVIDRLLARTLITISLAGILAAACSGGSPGAAAGPGTMAAVRPAAMPPGVTLAMIAQGDSIFHAKACADVPDQMACLTPVKACELAGEECKILACIDKSIGSISDNRVELIGK